MLPRQRRACFHVYRPSYLPNLLSSLRVVLAPAMLGAAYSNAKAGFAVLLAVILVTHVLDGPLARAWKVESTLGARLDRWGDGLSVVLAAVGVFFLWPSPVEHEWQWVVTALAGYLLLGLRRVIVPAVALDRTNWSWRLAGLALPLSLVPWLQQWSPWPFRAAAVLQLLLGVARFIAWSGRSPAEGPPSAPAGQPLPLARPVGGSPP